MSCNSRAARGAVLCLGLLGLTGCMVSQKTLGPGFGVALSEGLAAQIANPDVNYANRAAPPADGARVNLAITRYREGKVIRPTASASEVGEASASAGAGPGGAQ